MNSYAKRELELGPLLASQEADGTLSSFYDAAAQLIGAQSDEIVWCTSATSGWQMSLGTLSLAYGDRVVCHASEYASNLLALLQLAEKLGVSVDFAPSTIDGSIDVDRLPECIHKGRTKAIFVCHVPTQGGCVAKIEQIGTIAKNAGIHLVVDAAQSVGQLDLNVAKIGCSFLSTAGRKFLRGPRGTGILYVSRDAQHELAPQFSDIFSLQALSNDSYQVKGGRDRFELFESSASGRIGLTTAINCALTIGIAKIEARTTLLAERLRNGLSCIRGIRIHEVGNQRGALVTCSFEQWPVEQVDRELRRNGVEAYVITKINSPLSFEERRLPGSLMRFSPHYFNTEEEIDTVLERIETMLGSMR